MIASLRRRHRAMTTALALAVPTVLVLAVGARREPAVQELSEELRPTTGRVHQWARSHGAPDVLVYWSGEPASEDALPSDARLLLADELPAAARHVHLFSVAHGALLESKPAEELR